MNTPYFETIKKFLDDIGIPFKQKKLEDNCFLPGLKIDKGILFYDPEKLKYPGDILHEAGHIALMTEEEKKKIVGSVSEFREPGMEDEIGVLCWTFAALSHLKIPAEIVFHPEGYKGDSDMLIAGFQNGQYIGLPLLVWMELCDYESFPKMKKWIRA